MANYNPTGLAKSPEDMINLRDRDNRELQTLLSDIPRQVTATISVVSGAAATPRRHPYPGTIPHIFLQPVGASISASLVSVDTVFYSVTVSGGAGDQAVNVSFVDPG